MVRGNWQRVLDMCCRAAAVCNFRLVSRSRAVQRASHRVCYVVLTATVFAFFAVPTPSQALMINVNDLTGGAQPTALAAFNQAAALWETEFSDPVTVNIDFNFATLGAGVLGGTSSPTITASFGLVKTFLNLDAKSADDATAVANLPGGSSMVFRTNDVSGSIILDADASANNSLMEISRANAKALGLVSPNASATDASIEFSTSFTYDFDPSNGITAGTFDFVGLSAHEIGHALGFISGVDDVDFLHGSGPGGPLDLNSFSVFGPLDLYRYSNAAGVLGGGPTLDFAYGPHPGGLPFFSIDGGATSLATFETGKDQGTGRQASHWRDNLALGIMDPTFAPSELGVITALDIQAFDVIGWDPTLAIQLVPEPSTFTLLGIGGLALFGYGWRKRRYKLKGSTKSCSAAG